MTSRASTRRWLLRDIPRASVLLVFITFVIVIFAYLIDWSVLQRGSAARPTKDDPEQRYTGSIIIPTGSGDICNKFMLDNRTGQMRENGTINCAETARQFDEKP